MYTAKRCFVVLDVSDYFLNGQQNALQPHFLACCCVLEFTACATSSCSSWSNRCPQTVLEWNSSWTRLFGLDLCQDVRGIDSKLLPLSGKHNELCLLLRHMMVFSILLALLAVGGDFVHEFGSRGDLIVPYCTDLQIATQVSGVQDGSCWIQLSFGISLYSWV